MYGTRNVPLTFTFELRDKGKSKEIRTIEKCVSKNINKFCFCISIGRYGFILPSNQIIPNSLEVLDGLKAMINEAKTLKYFT